VLVAGPAPTQAFTAPVGAKIRGELRYDGTNRPAIAPFGVRAADSGDQSWLFPTVSTQKRYGKPFVIERLHAGPAFVRLSDLDAIYADHPDVLIPDELVSSARFEPGTSYWFTAGLRKPSLTAGETVNLGVLKLKLHGVFGVRAVLGREDG